MSRIFTGVRTFCLLSVLLALCAALAPAAAQTSAPLPTGVMASFFRGVSPETVKLATDSFASTMAEATGLTCPLSLAADAFDMAERLKDGQMKLGVFHGVEFAWVQRKHPELAPLMLAVDKRHPLQACLVVRADSGIARVDDLKGKSLAVPKRNEEHCRLFLKRQVGARADETGAGSPVTAANVEAALDSLYRADVQGVVVSARGLEFYRDLKPGCFAKLKVIEQSSVFPPHVVAYRPGSLDEATLGRLRDGLGRLAGFEGGRELLKQWHVQSFEAPPADFAQSLREVSNLYPTP